MRDRTVARVVGALFVVASATAIAGGALLLPVDESASLAEIAAADVRVVSGVLLELVLVWSVVAIAVLLFPILRRRDEALAAAYIGARTLESVLLLAAAVSALVVLALSQDASADAAAGVPVLTAVREWTYVLGSMLALGVGALVLYSVLLRARLVPSWLSVWGLAGATLIAVRGVLEMYGVEFSAVAQGAFAAPIATNEMVLAVWLIAKGFTPPFAAVSQADSRQIVPA